MSHALAHQQIEGTLVASNPPARLLVIKSGGSFLITSVSPCAQVRLHGELVRLRLLQVGDHVVVVASATPLGLVASSVFAESLPGSDRK